MKMSFLLFIAIVCIISGNPTSSLRCPLKTTSNPHRVKSGNTIAFICPATVGKTADELVWFKDNTKISNRSYTTSLTSSYLSLINVTLKDSGRYECRMKENSICTHKLQIHAPPKVKFWIKGSRSKYFFNRHETLYCTASGYPKPTLKWVFENKTVDQEDDKRGLSLGFDVIDSNQLTLTLSELSDADDLAGTYSCVANNSEGRDSIDIPVKFMKPYGPLLEMGPKTYVANINETVTLQCLAKDVYDKRYYKMNWYHNRIDFPNHETTFLKEKYIIKSIVTIVNVARTDAGFYVCYLNETWFDGRHQRKTMLVVVAQPGLPSVTLNHYQAEGKRVTLVCTGNYSRYDMEDRAKLIWIKDGLVLGTRSKYSISNNQVNTVNVQRIESTLTINQLTADDVGNYTCATMSLVKNVSVSEYISIDTFHGNKFRKDNLAFWEVVMVIAIICLLVGLITGVILRYMKRKKSLRRSSKGYGNYLYETFLTYSTKDYDWIKNKLLPLLEKYLVKYCLPHRDFEPGKALIENITDGIYQSRTVIAVISKNYMSSKKCRDELDVALYRVAERNENSLIVIRVDSIEKSQLPKALRNRTFLDYMDKEEKRHWERRLLKQLFKEQETNPLIEMS